MYFRFFAQWHCCIYGMDEHWRANSVLKKWPPITGTTKVRKRWDAQKQDHFLENTEIILYHILSEPTKECLKLKFPNIPSAIEIKHKFKIQIIISADKCVIQIINCTIPVMTEKSILKQKKQDKKDMMPMLSCECQC